VDDLLDGVVAEVQERFAGDALAALRERIAVLAARGADDLEADRQRLAARVAELDGMIARGNDNLALLPADVLPGVVARVRQWQQEREQAAHGLARLAVAAKERKGLAARVEKALKAIQQLHRVVRESGPAETRAALASVIKQVRVTYGPTAEKDGQWVTTVDVDIADAVVNLFTTSAS
jgi:hypothetical protein